MKFWQMIVWLFLLAPVVSLPYEDAGSWKYVPPFILGIVLGTMVKNEDA